MITKIKELISQKNKLYSCIKKTNNKQLLHSLPHHLSKSIENAKNKYFFRISEKLNDPNTSSKCKKYLAFLQFMIIIDAVSDFKEKCQLFNSYFSEQRTLLKNISTLCPIHVPNTKEDIYKIIKYLDPNKGHCHDMIAFT